MTTIFNSSSIPESSLEHRQNYATPWIDRWAIPNPFIHVLYPTLHHFGVALSDIGFNKDATNIDEAYLNITVRRLNAAIRVGLESVTYLALNADWNTAPDLVEIYDTVSAKIQDFLQQSPESQIFTLALHVFPGEVNFKEKTAQLVHVDLIGDAGFYGISAYREDGYTMIDKSLRHEGAAFIRLQRRFSGNVKFAEMAPIIYQEEMKALGFIGISGID